MLITTATQVIMLSMYSTEEKTKSFSDTNLFGGVCGTHISGLHGPH
jgi:hypothetical protein